MSVTIYGIKNCDTMKKAFKWLDEHNIAYDFHDYKKQAPDEAILKQAIAEHGWELVINQRGTSWRKLDESLRASMDEAGAIQVAMESPSIIKRPLIVARGKTILGFSEELYEQLT